ncbi:hypothetical protein ACFL37_01060 [Candidatus Margulisiibacteriota bacterium]
MAFRVQNSGFTKLRPGPMALKPWQGPQPPAYTTNLLRAIKDFGRYNGINFMPRATIDRLRTDRYFRYCFAPLVTEHHNLYQAEGLASELLSVTRQRLVRLLKDPGSVTDKDIFFGIDKYLNNFVGSMPGGYKRVNYVRYPDIYEGKKPLFDLIDRILQDQGWAQRAAGLVNEIEQERSGPKQNGTIILEPRENYSKRLEHRQLCLEVFLILVNEHGHRPIELWK